MFDLLPAGLLGDAAAPGRGAEGPLLSPADEAEFEALLRGGFSRDRLTEFFSRRPFDVARRLGEVLRVLLRIRGVWVSDVPQDAKGEELRRSLQQLGPIFVKLGQTLAQRPDLVSEEVTLELRGLQVNATAFPDSVAHGIILEDLGHCGPLAPGVCPAGCDPALPPLFADISDGPVAAASLGQVYRAMTHDGRELAVKVQRPRLARSVALDWATLFLLTKVYRTVRAAYNDFTVLADQVASGVFLELDYHNEARNIEEFIDLHRWLGFVTAPRWVREYTGPKGTARVLSTEWIDGRRFDELPRRLRRAAVRRLSEAVLVQLLITGLVHSDPHEGNLLYTADGRIAFLDFGLVDRVSQTVMQGFAEGMKNVVARNWTAVALSLQEIGWTTSPIQRNTRPGQPGPEYVDCDFSEFAEALGREFEKDKLASQRLGATVAAFQRLADRYLLLTPSYVILITRTFVTLEGVVARVDPDFNMFTTALPVTLRRFFSPATPSARRSLREAVLTPEGEVRWQKLEAVLNATGVVWQTPTGLGAGGAGDEADADLQGTVAEAFRPLEGLLGSADGRALRRLAYDLDARKALRFLASRGGRPWRRRAAAYVADAAAAAWGQGLGALRRLWPDAGASGRPRGGHAGLRKEGFFDERWRRRRRRSVGLVALSQLRRQGPALACLALLLAALLALRVAGGAALLLAARAARSLRGAAAVAALPVGLAVRASWGGRGRGEARRAAGG